MTTRDPDLSSLTDDDLADLDLEIGNALLRRQQQQQRCIWSRCREPAVTPLPMALCAEHLEQRQRSVARWDALRVPIEPSRLLTGLREAVLAIRHDRCPKWRFRLADDLVVQIQPRPGERRDRHHLFECVAIFGDGVTKEMFGSQRARRGRSHVEFGIKADDGGWRADPRAFGHASRADDSGTMMARLAEALPKLEVLDARKMFSAHCLFCGKALTDPASMARWIGPECAGTSSLAAGLFTPKGADQEAAA